MLTVATRAALALLDSTIIPVGTPCNVLDFGNGYPQMFWLQTDARAANGKLRVAALNKSGKNWVAGDGVSLLTSWMTAKIDLTTTSSNNPFVPALSGFYFVPITVKGARLRITDFSGVITTASNQNAGNNGAKNNIVNNGVIPSTAIMQFDTATGPVPVLGRNLNPTPTATLVNLATPVLLDVNTAATGTGPLVLKARFAVDGLLVATEEFA